MAVSFAVNVHTNAYRRTELGRDSAGNVQPLTSPSPREERREGEQPALVDHLDDLLLLRVNQHNFVADGEIAVVGELWMVARQFFRHRL